MTRFAMQIGSRRLLIVAGLSAAAMYGGCKRAADQSVANRPEIAVASAANPPAVALPATDHPATAPALVDYVDKNAHLQYPKSWNPKPDKDFDLHLVPNGPGARDITFDIADLPPHFPGMIRLGLIENGYVDDLKKKHPGSHVDSSAEHAMPDACKARLVESSWKQDGSTHSDVGLLMMRKEQVYILSCNADAKDLPATRADFDKIMASLHWDK